MFARLPAVVEDVVVVAAGVFQGVSEYWHAVEGALFVDARGEGEDGGCLPGGDDPANLHLPNERRDGADPAKLQRQIARHGKSLSGMATVARGAVPGVVWEAEDAELLDAIRWQLRQLANPAIQQTGEPPATERPRNEGAA